MATENVNMNIENTTTSSSAAAAPAATSVSPASGNVQLTAEMLSSAQVSVNMKFLADIRNVLDLATQRGAWRANELTAVGTLVDSLDNAFRQLASKTNEVASAASEGSGEDAGAGAAAGAAASLADRSCRERCGGEDLCGRTGDAGGRAPAAFPAGRGAAQRVPVGAEACVWVRPHRNRRGARAPILPRGTSEGSVQSNVQLVPSFPSLIWTPMPASRSRMRSAVAQSLLALASARRSHSTPINPSVRSSSPPAEVSCSRPRMSRPKTSKRERNASTP